MGRDSLTLIDAALPFNTGKIRRYIEAIGRSTSDLHQIVVTHAHPDHTGCIRALSNGESPRVLVYRDDTRNDGPGRRLYYQGQLFTFEGDLPLVCRIPVHGILEDGTTLPGWDGIKVLHTPGHTPGSVCLLDEERGVLITGDMLISDGRRFHRPLPFPGTDFRAYRSSIERLAALDFDTVCVGHGRPVVGGAKAQVERMLEGYFWAMFPWRLIPRLGRSQDNG